MFSPLKKLKIVAVGNRYESPQAILKAAVETSLNTKSVVQELMLTQPNAANCSVTCTHHKCKFYIHGFFAPFEQVWYIHRADIEHCPGCKRRVIELNDDPEVDDDAAEAASRQPEPPAPLLDPREVPQWHNSAGTPIANPNTLSKYDYSIYTGTEDYSDARAQLFGFCTWYDLHEARRYLNQLYGWARDANDKKVREHLDHLSDTYGDTRTIYDHIYYNLNNNADFKGALDALPPPLCVGSPSQQDMPIPFTASVHTAFQTPPEFAKYIEPAPGMTARAVSAWRKSVASARTMLSSSSKGTSGGRSLERGALP